MMKLERIQTPVFPSQVRCKSYPLFDNVLQTNDFRLKIL